MNTAKTALLLTVLSLILVGIGGTLGGKTGLTIALVMAVGMNLISYWFSDRIILKMYRAREVTESEAPDLYATVRRLSQNASIPMPRVYLMDQEQPNAFATGRNPEHGVIALTTGIMKILTREELEGVIAHELAHIKNRDILLGTIAATIAAAVSCLAQMAQWAMIFGGGSEDDRDGTSPFVAIVMMIVAPIAALLIQMAISRSREYRADATGSKISGNPMCLSGALRKLEAASQRIRMEANPATAHMYIVNPLTGKGIAKLFSTHPPIEDRIARLENVAV